MRHPEVEYCNFINRILPERFTHPVRYNHCFARIILDWTFQDCWHGHLKKYKPAIRQLSEAQVQQAVHRMAAWLADPQLLIADNKASLGYRRDFKNAGQHRQPELF